MYPENNPDGANLRPAPAKRESPAQTPIQVERVMPRRAQVGGTADPPTRSGQRDGQPVGNQAGLGHQPQLQVPEPHGVGQVGL